MSQNNVVQYIEKVLLNLPNDWLGLTTHRLDIYDEQKAKTQFIDEFDALFAKNDFSQLSLESLPTAYDYIRLGHPLSCVLEWTIGTLNKIQSHNIVCFSSLPTPILAIVRKNQLTHKKTRIIHFGNLPICFDVEVIKSIYRYEFEIIKADTESDIAAFDGCSILLSNHKDVATITTNENIDFQINLLDGIGSILIATNDTSTGYISDIQHVRRRETIAMTPINCLSCLENLTGKSILPTEKTNIEETKSKVNDVIQQITQAPTTPLVASSGLSIQYAIMMGLIHDAQINHPNKAIKFVVPPNCYGGTNDQARRVAACLPHVEIVDLHVDGDHNMVESLDQILTQISHDDAIAFIIAEIPTNPRVEVPEMEKLKETLCQIRYTASNTLAVEPVFILDQTFCPNVHFLGEGKMLSEMKAISYASGSKFPSGGLCTAGYCVSNDKAAYLMEKIALHLSICDNEATSHQYEILAKQLPSMNQRIEGAYVNTRQFVRFIEEVLPAAKINFVSEELAKLGFTPSVFSLDLPTKGDTQEEREKYKRALNHRLIDMMITSIPQESKYCVSYGHLKGCYWTIPATSTQGTTKEVDKDYIARVSLSANMDLEKHKEIFLAFVDTI